MMIFDTLRLSSDSKVFYDQKRHLFLRQAKLFRCLPFITAVYASGSLALNNMEADSDFDVLVVSQDKRLYSARFFCLLVFGILGWRTNLKSKKQGFCFNHFISASAFQNLKPESNYERILYKKMFKVYERSPRSVAAFFQVLGDVLEVILKKVQVWKIKQVSRQLAKPYSVVYYTDEEVRIWFDPKSREEKHIAKEKKAEKS